MTGTPMGVCPVCGEDAAMDCHMTGTPPACAACWRGAMMVLLNSYKRLSPEQRQALSDKANRPAPRKD